MTDWKAQFEDAEERAGIATMWLGTMLELVELTMEAVQKLYDHIAMNEPGYPNPADVIAATRAEVARARAETGLDKVDA